MARHIAPVAEALRSTAGPADAQENGLRRRAHRVALVLMIGSSLISMLALYGIWTLLRTVI